MKLKTNLGPILLNGDQASLIHQILTATGNIELANVIATKGKLTGSEVTYASIARKYCDETLEFDESPLVSISDDGAHVMAWKWIATSEL
jgi:hypothetical protein